MPIRLGRSGQFIPLAAMAMFTAVVFMVAVVNVYKVAQAKMVTQQMADSIAKLVAGMQAKAVNAVIDRNEWMNHMYSQQTCPPVKGRFPGISCADKHKFGNKNEAVQYAKLVATINMWQWRTIQAYNGFIGADGKTASTSITSGGGGLKDILRTNYPDLKELGMVIHITNSGSDSVPDPEPANGPGSKESTINHGGMNDLPFETVEVRVKADDMKVSKTLTELARGKQSANPMEKVGWIQPKWDDQGMALKDNTSNPGKRRRVWGVRVDARKKVNLSLLGPLGHVWVRARATAYLDRESGRDGEKKNANGPIFKPTYYLVEGAS